MNKLSEIQNLPVLWDGPVDSDTLLILAHGAGAPMDTPFMNYFAQHLANKNIRVLRFEFPYMALRRKGGNKRPPNPQQVLLTSWRHIIDHSGSYKRKIIGGKSMGGRMASMIADECHVDGLICLGYPFYALGKTEKPRIEHLKNIKTKSLILQGDRDVMGSKKNVEIYDLSSQIKIHWLPDGNHDLKPRLKSGFTEIENFENALDEIAYFLELK